MIENKYKRKFDANIKVIKNDKKDNKKEGDK